MKKRRFPKLLFLLFLLLIVAGLIFGISQKERSVGDQKEKTGLEQMADAARAVFDQEPEQVKKLREQETAQTEEGHQEYYFQLLKDQEKVIYRQMLQGIRERKEEFYLTSSEDEVIDSLFSPGYTYTNQEVQEIQAAMEQGYQEMTAMIPENADDYEKVKTVYTYLIDTTEYVSSDHDQNLAGVFWKKQAVCAGYARSVQYFLERLGIPCIYVEGSTKGSTEGHAWNIVLLDGQYYYVDATNGDQPEFLEGDAVQFVEHKTTLYDYLCPFPDEYREIYTASEEFPVPECTAVDKNFYVLNQGCFDTYDTEALYSYCKMRLDNGAAVVRFKFSTQKAYNEAYREWIQESYIDRVAEYYLQLYGLESVEYHYGLLENMKTMYFMF